MMQAEDRKNTIAELEKALKGSEQVKAEEQQQILSWKSAEKPLNEQQEDELASISNARVYDSSPLLSDSQQEQGQWIFWCNWYFAFIAPIHNITDEGSQISFVDSI